MAEKLLFTVNKYERLKGNVIIEINSMSKTLPDEFYRDLEDLLAIHLSDGDDKLKVVGRLNKKLNENINNLNIQV